jgi:hypothetical protein
LEQNRQNHRETHLQKWAKRKKERREGRWRFASNLASGKVEKDRAERIQQGSNSRGGVVTVPESKNSRKQNRKQRRAAIDFQVSRFAATDVFSVQKIDVFVPQSASSTVPKNAPKMLTRQAALHLQFPGGGVTGQISINWLYTDRLVSLGTGFSPHEANCVRNRL